MAITFDQFIDKYSGRYCDWDGYYGAQCADLANAYCIEVLGAPPMGGNAVDFWKTAHEMFTRDQNTPTNTPPNGAIVIWHQSPAAGTGVYGHVGIAMVNEGIGAFTSFDQNWPVGSPPHKQRHTYDGVTGWLIHPSVANPAPNLPGPPKSAADAVDTLRRHSAALTDNPSVAGTNALLVKVRGWPVYDK